MYILRPEICKGQAKFSYYEGAFSPEECDKIISYFDEKTAINAGTHYDNRLNDGIRKSRVTWLHYIEERRWLWDKLAKYIKDANTRWNFQLHGMLEALQLTEYATGGHYTWHEDNTEPAHSCRKLSLVIQLTAPDQYEGGDLVMFPNMRAPRTRGTITFFPSYYVHKVEPVKQGTRYSLVAWVTGDPFR